MIVYKDGTLYASTSGNTPLYHRSKSLRLRRLFYVGKCTVVAISGVLPVFTDLTGILKNLAFYVMEYEKTGKFAIPLEVSQTHRIFSGIMRNYFILTVKGLYQINEDGLTVLDDEDVHVHGSQAGLFRMCYQHYGDVEKCFRDMHKYDDFISEEIITAHRHKLGTKYVVDNRQYSSTIMGEGN